MKLLLLLWHLFILNFMNQSWQTWYLCLFCKMVISKTIKQQSWWQYPYLTEVAHTNSMHQSIADSKPQVIGRFRLSVSTVNRAYELSGITHVTSFRKYGKHSTVLSTYGPWVRTYSKLFSCKSVLTVCSYKAQSNEIHMHGRVSRGSIPRVRRYGLLYLRTVEYDHCDVIAPSTVSTTQNV